MCCRFHLFIDRLVEDLDLRVFRFTPYGKNRIKTFNVSPDVYIQLMLQWTYYKLVLFFIFFFKFPARI